jgi:hypothetical protein
VPHARASLALVQSFACRYSGNRISSSDGAGDRPSTIAALYSRCLSAVRPVR